MIVDDLFVLETISIRDAIEVMDRIGKGILLIGENRIIKAVLTDGDIRRYLIKNKMLPDGPISQLANYNPKTIDVNEASTKNIKEYMKKNRLRVGIVVDCDNYVYNVIFDDNGFIKNTIAEQIDVVIMAGGKGKRLLPLTNILPKPLIPVGDKAIIEHIINQFEEYGCRKFDVIINYKKEIIRAFFLKDNYRNALNSEIKLFEEREFLGTAGGLKLVENRIDGTFIMSNCDILVNADFAQAIEVHKEMKNKITVLAAIMRTQIPYGTLEIDDANRIVNLTEKPSIEYLINTGVYIVEADVISLIKDNEYLDFTDLIERCVDNGMRVGTYNVPESSWMDMGEISELCKISGF